jgi:hypothetical protein
MADLDRALRDLGEHLDYPAAPNLATAVHRRLAAADADAVAHGRRRVPPVVSPRRRVLASFAAGAVLLLGVLGFWAPAREAVADLFGLPGVIFSREPSPVPPGERIPLGAPVGLDDARGRADLPLRVPTRLGPPDAVYIDEGGPETVVSMVYRPDAALVEVGSTGVGLLLSQFHGRFDAAVMTKFLGPGSRAEPVSVNGQRGFWLPEPAHVVLYLDREGNVREDTARLTANVLLWEDHGVLTRIESRLGRDEMLVIASSTG